MFQVADYLFIGSLVFASLLLTLLLVLWLQCPSQRSGYLASSGTLKVQIAGQFVAELVMISIPASSSPMELQDFLPKQSEIRYSRT